MLLHAWLAARSIARGLPPPVREYGGFRIDTNSGTEVARWVFPKMGSGLERLAHSIDRPGYFLKFCGAADELRAVLPPGWMLHAPSYFMRGSGKLSERCLAEGYRIEIDRIGMVVEARILTETGEPAASGYAVETPEVFIYDRIVTEPAHRRKGLGHAVMASLHGAQQNSDRPELLVATEDGLALYSSLGWEIISPYSTAAIAP